jgi:hypothetical protein
MKWGAAQNLFSILIGLNVAYYAFKEIRNPYLTELMRRTEEIYSDFQSRWNDLSLPDLDFPDKQTLRSALITAWVPIVEYHAEVRAFAAGIASSRREKSLGLVAIFVSGCATLLLIISCVKYEDSLPAWIFYPSLMIGFAPVIMFILNNYLILWAARRKFEARYDEIWNFLHLKFDDKLRPHGMEIAEARRAAKSRGWQSVFSR